MKSSFLGLSVGVALGVAIMVAVRAFDAAPVPPAAACHAPDVDLSAVVTALGRIDARLAALERVPAAPAVVVAPAPVEIDAVRNTEATARQIADRPAGEWGALIRESLHDDPDVLAALIAMANRKELDHAALMTALHAPPAP